MQIRHPISLINLRELPLRNLLPQKLAQRLPPISRVPLQQPLPRHNRSHPRIVLLVTSLQLLHVVDVPSSPRAQRPHAHGIVLAQELPVQDTHDLHPARVEHSVVRPLHAGDPAVDVPLGQDHFRVRVSGQQFFREQHAGRVGQRVVAPEHFVEVRGRLGHAFSVAAEFGGDGRVPEVEAAVGVVEAGFEAVVGAVAELV